MARHWRYKVTKETAVWKDTLFAISATKNHTCRDAHTKNSRGTKKKRTFLSLAEWASLSQ